MSWFTEIAGKAEDLLNKVDQTAATALQNKSKSASYSPKSHYSKQCPTEVSYNSYSASSAYSSPNWTPSTPVLRSSSSDNKQLYSPGTLTPRKKPESDDEKLLRFLNCSESLPNTSRKMKGKEEIKEGLDIESQSCAPENSSLSDAVDSQDEILLPKNDSNLEVKQDFLPSPSEAVNIGAESSTKDAIDSTSLSFDSSKVDVQSDGTVPTPEDFKLVQKRAEHAEAEMKRMIKKLDHWNSQISGNDKLVRELKEREKDMIAAMDAKDSQLAILKVRLQEADQELLMKQNVIDELKAENERIIKDHAEGATFQNKTAEVLREQLQQAEIELNKTKESFQQLQTEHMHQMSKLEEEHRHLVESYTSLQKKWTDMNERNKELTIQLKNANANFDTIQQEYNDYKQKAQRILQSKEKLISTLKEGNFDADSIEKHEDSSALLNAEIEGIKQERELLKEELRRSNELIETYRSEVQELEKISQHDLSSAQERCRMLKEQLDMEKVQKEELQALSTQLKEESQVLREDLTRTKSTFQSRLQDREIEIEKLRRQLTAKSLSSVSQDELESRLHALTENLIQKQTLVEALSTEKNSLVLQLERLEQQLREAQNYGAQQHTFVGINNNEAERKSKTIFLENPFDSALTRRVKKVYGTIDSLSIRLGVFFRRYPITRVFVFIYMLLLHFWVMIVLLTYEPEIHNSTHESMQNQ